MAARLAPGARLLMRLRSAASAPHAVAKAAEGPKLSCGWLLASVLWPCCARPPSWVVQVHDIVAGALLAAEPRIGTEVRMKAPHRNTCFEVRFRGC